ncbi:hypothetical protein N0V90_000711 [Kalmusia sp. IMI 367209]|nr:hypothetical protein N0V90_000711 [Kalmusia sp. IMI 367209]
MAITSALSSTRSLNLSLIILAVLFVTSFAQNASNCPLGGPIYPVPVSPLTKSLSVPRAISNLQYALDAVLKDSTINSSKVSFHVTVFSANDILFDYSHVALRQNHSLTTNRLNRNTIFRIGSVSKFVTIYALLAATGTKHLNDPVTKWVPELAQMGYEDDVSSVQWQEVTIGALAGHMAGVKELAMEDLATLYNASNAEKYALPPLSSDEVPTCGTAGELPACSRGEFFAGFKNLRPVTSPFHMPIYSNVAFQILAYAIEGMSNSSFANIFQSTLVEPLGLNGTYLTKPPTSLNGSGAIIPEDQALFPWNMDSGDGTSSANGLMFSTAADLAKLGQSILSSTLLPSHTTRQWLKPIAHTPDLRLSVGMPWEIIRLEIPVPVLPSSPSARTTRILDLYTKNGGTGTYNTQFLLSPDHGFGFSVLTAGPPPDSGADLRFAAMQTLSEMVVETLVDGFEEAALEQAVENFVGTYAAVGNDASNISLVITAGDGRLGLGVKSWTDGTRNLLKTYFAALGMANVDDMTEEPSLRIYPVDLSNRKQTAFRGVFEYKGSAGMFSTRETTAFGSRCAAFAAVDEPQYGNVGMDDFVFDVNEDGMATGVTARGARQMLQRQV